MDIRLSIYFINSPIPQRDPSLLPIVVRVGHLEQQWRWAADRSMTPREVALQRSNISHGGPNRTARRPPCLPSAVLSCVRFCFDRPQLVFPWHCGVWGEKRKISAILSFPLSPCCWVLLFFLCFYLLGKRTHVINFMTRPYFLYHLIILGLGRILSLSHIGCKMIRNVTLFILVNLIWHSVLASLILYIFLPHLY